MYGSQETNETTPCAAWGAAGRPARRGEACTHLGREARAGGKALTARELPGGCLNQRHFWRETRPAKLQKSSFSEHETKLSRFLSPKRILLTDRTDTPWIPMKGSVYIKEYVYGHFNICQNIQEYFCRIIFLSQGCLPSLWVCCGASPFDL